MNILEIVKSQEKNDTTKPQAHIIIPSEGFCVKLRTVSNEKVFVNICHSDKVPKPNDITEDELRAILEDIEGSPPFKIPMSIGEPHAELDAAGKGCTAYDIIVNPTFLKKVQTSELFEAFLMTVIFEGLEDKFDLHLERKWVVLKNKRSLGRLHEQFVRAANRPAIVEMNNPTPSVRPNLIQEVPESEDSDQRLLGEVPQYKLITVPERGPPEFLVAQINLPKLRSGRGLMLDVASDMLCLGTRSQVYAMEILLDPQVDEDRTAAEFNRSTQVLTVTMPVRTTQVY
ncbi:hypothetical protein P879_02942 [Paragonimus westermani]|uniref:PIH1 domain-containing protein 1 n=1 Tax=Paragonimus westermani TaxID=34504 RepID=A0A8T0DME8_9TREM|nr:hypothetical protein P879_02942 [Paragonimus westermani]